MIKLLKAHLKNTAKKIPPSLKNILKKFGAERLWEFFIGKYADELNFQFGWAKAYNGKSEELKEALTNLWKNYRCLDEIKEICCFSDDKKVLDVGCGIATVLHILKGEKYGIDPLGNEYKKIYSYPKDITIKKGFAEKIPFQSEMFDVVLCSNALDHTTDPEKALKEMDRVLVSKGLLTLVVETKNFAVKRDIKHPHTFTVGSLKNLISTTRFNTVFEKEVPWHGGQDSKGYVTILQKE